MLTKEYESVNKLHTHTHTHNCYRQEIVKRFYANFGRNVKNKIDMNLVKGDEFL